MAPASIVTGWNLLQSAIGFCDEDLPSAWRRARVLEAGLHIARARQERVALAFRLLRLLVAVGKRPRS
ncbi:MAG: hypothetical protein ACRDPA_14355 [Solirubrobacteraceae bacterium]